jgi:hypothetical protein
MNVPAIAHYLHKVLSLSQDAALLRPAARCVINNCTYLRQRFANDARMHTALDTFPLYGAEASGNGPIVQWMVRWSRNKIFSEQKGLMLESMRDLTSHRVLAAVEGGLRDDVPNVREAAALQLPPLRLLGKCTPLHR